MKPAIRWIVGAIAGLLDLTGQVSARNRVLRLVRYDSHTANGFDATADLYRFLPR